jgi:hypothetical protein
MIYVAVGLAGHQPGTGAALLARTAGIATTAISAVSGLLLVPDGMSFEVSVAVSLTDFLVLARWLYLVSRWLGRSSALRSRHRAAQVLRSRRSIGAAARGS